MKARQELKDSLNIKIIEYRRKYINDVRDLLLAQETEISKMDLDNLDRVHSDYRIKYTALELDEMRKSEGKCYLAIEDDKVVGLVLGIIYKYGKYDYLDYKCPKRGQLLEIIVKKTYRRKGIGKILLKELEKYFISQKCEYMVLEVLSYNKIAKDFYKNNDFHERTEFQIKKLDREDVE